MDPEPIDALYYRILMDAFASRPDVQDTLRRIASIVALFESLPLATLAHFLGESPKVVYQDLQPFRSIILVPQEPSGFVSSFPDSFRTFLSDESRSGEFYLGGMWNEIHYRLARKCMSILENIGEKEGRKPEGFQHYAITYWVPHVVATKLPDDDDFHERVGKCLSIWMKKLPAEGTLLAHARGPLAELVVWVGEKVRSYCASIK